MNLIVSASLVPERWVGKKAAPLRSFLPAFGASRMKSIFVAALGGSVHDLRTRKGTPRRQSQFRHQQADQESLLQSRSEVQ